MIEWIVTAWLVVGSASGDMTYGFTDRSPCEIWRGQLLTSRVPLLVGPCEKGDDKEYKKRILGRTPNLLEHGKVSAGYQEIIDRGLWMGNPARP